MSQRCQFLVNLRVVTVQKLMRLRLSIFGVIILHNGRSTMAVLSQPVVRLYGGLAGGFVQQAGTKAAESCRT